jgi:hypothetical protein
MTIHSSIERETLALMRREPPGAAMRHACEDFEKFWASAIAGQPRGKLVNPEVEETCKRIARLAFLEGKGL